MKEQTKEIEFSPCFEPLFDVLSAWDITGDKQFTKLYNEDKQKYWNDLTGVDTIVLYGGRDSGKTFAESTMIPIAVSDFNHRILYTRYTMSSTDHSISEALSERMELIGIDNDFEYANNTYRCKHNDGKIFITGHHTSSKSQTAKLKSLEGFSMFITDEAEEIKTFEEWDKIRSSIRATDVQCLNMVVFNPPTREHWLFTDLFEDNGVQEGFNGVKGNILYIHSTYFDNIDHVAEHNLRKYDKWRRAYELYESYGNLEKENSDQQIKKLHKKYKHIVLGGFQSVADGVIYEDWEIGAFNDSLPYNYGIDFGFNDPDAVAKVAVDHNEMKIYVKEIHFKNNVGTPRLMMYLHELIGVSDLIIGDSAQKRLINDLYHGMYGSDGEWYQGLNIKKVRKSKGIKNNFVGRGIKTLQGYTFIIDGESYNMIKAFNNYCWSDRKGGVPHHDWSDLMDAIRYGALEQIEY